MSVTKGLFRDDAYRQTCQAVVVDLTEHGMITDQSVFYPMAGGQPGDLGRWVGPQGEGTISDTLKYGQEGAIEHRLAEPDLMPKIGDEIRLELDWARRYRLMRMHSCLHLLCCAVDGTVTGGSIGDGKGRLDFDIPEPVLDKEVIAATIHAWIEGNHAISSRFIEETELDRRPDLVRTMSVRPPRGQGLIRLVEIEGIDLQACGGTHVRNTSEIGAIRVAKIEKKGKQNRRVQIVFED